MKLMKMIVNDTVCILVGMLLGMFAADAATDPMQRTHDYEAGQHAAQVFFCNQGRGLYTYGPQCDEVIRGWTLLPTPDGSALKRCDVPSLCGGGPR